MRSILHDNPAQRDPRIKDYQMRYASEAEEVLVIPARKWMRVPRSVLLRWFASDFTDIYTVLDILQ